MEYYGAEELRKSRLSACGYQAAITGLRRARFLFRSFTIRASDPKVGTGFGINPMLDQRNRADFLCRRCEEGRDDFPFALNRRNSERRCGPAQPSLKVLPRLRRKALSTSTPGFAQRRDEEIQRCLRLCFKTLAGHRPGEKT